MADIHRILKQYWGYDRFRPLQEDIIQSVLDGHDTLALLPTGGGKSICFQVPAMVREGICIVVSPLIALMKDQVEQLQKRQIKAKAIYSGMSHREIDITLDNCVYGDVKFLYLSPERLKTALFIERAKKMKIGLLAVDEAHCVSQWGYDFRPSYLEITRFRELIPHINCVALTATATREVQQDIQDKLAFTKARVFQKSFARPNLSYSCFAEENKEGKLLSILRNVPGTAIVYVQTRKRTRELAEFLQRQGISADYYHAGLPAEQRIKKQDQWIANRCRVIVATNAFGMGIDKPDVRVVVHMDLPANLESYYQEAGRAGRDEQKAYAVVLYHKQDLSELQQRVLQAYPAPDHIINTYQKLANYYKLAVGSSQMASYDFDIGDFHKTFQLDYLTTYHAIKQLELQGFIQLTESFYSPSKVNFLVDNMELYRFRVANAGLDPLLKLMLRLYGGELFNRNSFTVISEAQLAQQLKTSKENIEKMLLFLQKSNIIAYLPQKDTPQLTFTTARYHAENLPFDIKALEEKKQRDEFKMNKIIDYVSHRLRCRTQLLLEYFDQISDETCGVCDVCLAQKKQQRQQTPDYVAQIIYWLAKESLSPQQLLDKIRPPQREALIEQIRQLLDSGELVLNAQGQLQLGIS